MLKLFAPVCLIVACAAHALPTADSSTLFRQIEDGDLGAARKTASALENSHAGDPELKFARALIAERSGETGQAIALYEELTRSHPYLLEPFNNLAIHQAGEGDYKGAIETLERAMRSNPAVATAYANLTAIYAQLASAAYRKALNSSTPLSPLNLAAIDKIQSQSLDRAEVPSLVSSVESFVNDSIATSQQAEQVAAVESAPEAAEPSRPALQPLETEPSEPPASPEVEVVVVTPEPAPEPEPEPVVEAETEVASAPEPEPVVTPEPEPEPEPESEPEPEVEVASVQPSAEALQAAQQTARDKQALINHIKSWAKAWSDRDVDRYLNHYSNSFAPRDGLSLEEWKKQRYGRLRWREFIIVKPSQYNIDLDGNEATVNFTQYYKSERFEDTIRKTLKFKKSGNQWLIVKELI